MARKKKTTVDTAKDKAAKQKKILILLVVVLAGAIAYAMHTMSSLNGGSTGGSSKPQAVAAGQIAPPTSAPAAATGALPAAPSLAATPLPTAGASTAAPSGTDSSSLVSVVVPKAGQGQLESFTRFASKDPFAAGLPSAPSAGSGSKGSGSSGSGSTPATPPAPPSPPPSSAVISVNGSSESVSSGANFPAANPVASTNGIFQLVSLTAHTAKVAIAGGSYAGGSATVTLKENKPVTLVNTADGTRYTLVLYPQGSVAPGAAAGASSGGSSSAPSTPSTPSTPSAPGTTTTSGG